MPCSDFSPDFKKKSEIASSTVLKNCVWGGKKVPIEERYKEKKEDLFFQKK